MMEDPPQTGPAEQTAALSGEEIRRAIIERRIGVAPILEWGDPKGGKSQFGYSSLDLRLGNHFRVPRDSAFGVIDSTGRIGRTGEGDRQDFYQLVRCRYGQPFVLHPSRFALAYTLEYLMFPPNLMGYVVGRSSWGRLGLIIATATMVNPRFRGVITLELANVGSLPVTLYPAMRIAQIVIHPTIEGIGEESKYLGQLAGNSQKLFRDRDIPWVAPRSTTSFVGIVGATGSGKSLLTAYFAERGYRHYSLADVVRRVARERGMSLNIEVLQDLGDEIRQRKSQDYLAREIADEIRRDGDQASRVVVTGFKHPSELSYFLRDERFRPIAISADEGACLKFKQQEMGGGELPDAEREEFSRIWLRDFDSKVAYGQNVRQCVQMPEFAERGRIILKTAEMTLAEFKAEAREAFEWVEEGV